MSSLAVQAITFARQVIKIMKDLSPDRQTAFLNLLLLSKEKSDQPAENLRLAKQALALATPRQLMSLNKKFLLDE